MTTLFILSSLIIAADAMWDGVALGPQREVYWEKDEFVWNPRNVREEARRAVLEQKESDGRKDWEGREAIEGEWVSDGNDLRHRIKHCLRVEKDRNPHFEATSRSLSECSMFIENMNVLKHSSFVAQCLSVLSLRHGMSVYPPNIRLLA